MDHAFKGKDSFDIFLIDTDPCTHIVDISYLVGRMDATNSGL